MIERVLIENEKRILFLSIIQFIEVFQVMKIKIKFPNVYLMYRGKCLIYFQGICILYVSFSLFCKDASLSN